MSTSFLEFKNFEGDMNFCLEQGFIMGVIGKNGAGKTTFFNKLLGKKKKYKGQVLFCGEEIFDNHIKFVNQVGVISEDNKFYSTLSISDNVKLLGGFYDNFDNDAFKEMLARVQVSGGKKVEGLSRGEMMKFQLAFAVAHHPKLYIIDEATAGMDPVFKVEFYRILHELLEKEECSILMSTHIDEEIDKQMDYIAMFENGKMVSFKENFPE